MKAQQIQESKEIEQQIQTTNQTIEELNTTRLELYQKVDSLRVINQTMEETTTQLHDTIEKQRNLLKSLQDPDMDQMMNKWTQRHHDCLHKQQELKQKVAKVIESKYRWNYLMKKKHFNVYNRSFRM